MKYHLVAGVATSAFTFLVSATSNIPTGCSHKEGWGNAVVQNKCSEPVYFILDNEPSQAMIAPASTTSIPIYEKDADNGGMSIKLFKNKDTDIWAVPAITQFEITATDLQYFDISNVNSNIGTGQNGNGEDCDKEPPFMNDGLAITTPGPDAKHVTCAAGQNPCRSAYSKNDDNFATAATALGNDITLTICPGGKMSAVKGSVEKLVGAITGGGQKKEKAPKKPAKKPAEKPAEKPVKAAKAPKVEEKVQEQGDSGPPKVVWVNKVVTADPVVHTQIVQVPGKEKRQEHIHQHVHNKIHKRRHGA